MCIFLPNLIQNDNNSWFSVLDVLRMACAHVRRRKVLLIFTDGVGIIVKFVGIPVYP